MGIRGFYIIVLVFFISSAFLIFKKPYYIKQNIDKEYDTKIEFKELNALQIDTKGVKYLIHSKSMIKKDELIEANEVVAYRLVDGNLEEARAMHLLFLDDIATFKKDVMYKNGKNFKLMSSDIVYDMANNTIASNSPFTVQTDNSLSKGDTFLYTINDKKFEATNIKSKIYMSK